MSNYAALISPLVISGSRKSDGSANASGVVYAMQPGTNNPVSIYADAGATSVVSQPITLDVGGRVSESDYPDGIYAKEPIRLLVQDTTGATVSDSVFIPASAGNTGVSNTGFTGTTVDEVLSDLYASTGGVDGQYLESSGATARTIKSKFSEISISVKDFGAVGNGVAIDTTAIQTAVNRVIALGGGIVYFPPGNYIIDQAITASSATGLQLVGSGIGSTRLTCTNATANCFTLSSCVGVRIEGMNIIHSSSSTGATVSVASSVQVAIQSVHNQTVAPFSSTGYFRYGVNCTGSTFVSLYDCNLQTLSGDANARGILCTDSSYMRVFGGTIGGTSGYGIEFTGTSGDFGAYGSILGTLRFAVGLTGTLFSVVGCGRSSSSSGFFSVATATDPIIRQFGNQSDGSLVSQNTGTTMAVDRSTGEDITLKAAGGGAGTVTVSAPTPPPLTTVRHVYLTTRHVNAAGGAVTWSMNAAYVLAGGTAIPTTDGHTILMRWIWDGATSKWREVSRSDTTT